MYRYVHVRIQLLLRQGSTKTAAASIFTATLRAATVYSIQSSAIMERIETMDAAITPAGISMEYNCNWPPRVGSHIICLCQV